MLNVCWFNIGVSNVHAIEWALTCEVNNDEKLLVRSKPSRYATSPENQEMLSSSSTLFERNDKRKHKIETGASTGNGVNIINSKAVEFKCPPLRVKKFGCEATSTVVICTGNAACCKSDPLVTCCLQQPQKQALVTQDAR